MSTKTKIQRPYCRIDNVVYQLEYVDGVLRFPNDGRKMPDLNIWALQYFKGERPLSDIWEYHTHSGTSYEMTWSLFSTKGCNNHMVTQGKEKTKSFRLYK